MSGDPRWSPTTPATAFWYCGREKTADGPPPPAPYWSCHATSGLSRSPLGLRSSVVPPTAVTSGSDAGQVPTWYLYRGHGARFLITWVGPLSPEGAITVTW